MKNEKEIRYIDLFGGVGGFRLGIERTKNSILQQNSGRKRRESGNFLSLKKGECCEYLKRTKWESEPIHINAKCVFYSDNDKYAVQTYNKNFKENWKPTDIRKVWSKDIPDFDMLCGGFPCQAFSIAGKRKGFEETRGTLFFEICRIIKSHRPKIVFLENVKGLLSHDRGRTFAIILSSLDELGYDVEWQVLNSKYFGVPQNRERVFIIGHLREESSKKIFPIGKNGEISNENIGKTSRSIQINEPKEGFCTNNSAELLEDGERRCLYFGEGKTMIRRLTPKECERLQGFPDNWTEGVSDTQRYRQMGNAVTVNVIEAISKGLICSNG